MGLVRSNEDVRHPFDVRGVSILEIPGPKVIRETIYYDPAPALA
jgi:hypothetical protein